MQGESRQAKLITVIARYIALHGGNPPFPKEGESGLSERAESTDEAFGAEVARLRASGALGESGRLLELFDYLAARGAAAEPASQAAIADDVFGQSGTDGDDATVRVYVHRLRKRLDDFYAENSAGQQRLTIPAGTYALRLVEAAEAEPAVSPPIRLPRRWWPAAAALALVLVFLAGWFIRPVPSAPHANSIWQPFIDSDRPIVVAVGDYYIFGEFDHLDPENGRLIRDFTIDSPTDLARAQESDPARYEATEDMGLNYLPFSSAYGLSALMPVLSQHDEPVSIIPASQVTTDTFRNYNVVYIGLVSGMGLLEDVNFMNSSFMVGATYDDLIDIEADKTYSSQEALRLASNDYYRDYGYLSVFHEPGGALVAVVAGARDTGLRGIAPIAAGSELPTELAGLASAERQKGFEALFEIRGQQGSDLSEKLVAARARP
jgi:hypothetical protein